MNSGCGFREAKGAWPSRGWLPIWDLSHFMGKKDSVSIRMSGEPLGTPKSEAIGWLRPLLHHPSTRKKVSPSVLTPFPLHAEHLIKEATPPGLAS